MKRSRRHRKSRHMLERLERRCMLAADPIISEFMADNGGSLVDEDNAAVDWIEIHNRGDEAIDLEGWFLTDNDANLEQWAFPTTALAAGDYVVLFASGKDRIGTGPNGEHHTNFSLDADGERLALIMPDGSTIVSEFGSGGAEYPSQREDISYGIINEVLTETSLVDLNSTTHALVPTAADAGNFGDSWRGGDEVNFENAGGNDAWLEGTLPAGFGTSMLVTDGLIQDLDANLGVTANGNVVQSWENQIAGSGDDVATNRGTPEVVAGPNGHNAIRFTATARLAGDDHDIFDSLMHGSGYTWFVVAQPGTQNSPNKNQMLGTLREGAPWSGFTGGVRADGRAYHMSRPGGGDVFGIGTSDVLDTYHLFAGRQAAGTGAQLAELFVDGLTPEASISPNIQPTTDAGALTIGSERVGGGEHFDGDIARILIYDRALSDEEIETVGRYLDIEYALDTEFDGGGNAHLGLDLTDEMAGINPSAYLRTEFEVADRSAFDTLTLSAQVDDGMLVYLNGTEVARINAPDPAAFDATATAVHEPSVDLEFDLSAELENAGALRDGTNVLGIHGFNVAVDDNDFFVSATLTAEARSADQIRYFLTPTPGAENVGGVLGFVADTQFSFDRGFYEEPIAVSITTNTTDAEIYYTLDGSVPTPGNPNAVLHVNAIDIAATTTLRAAAYLTDYEPTNVDTHTYVFVDDVIVQPEMDPDIVSDPLFAPTIGEDLKALPTLSLVMDDEDIFGPNGIYSNPQNRGLAWEREASIEYFVADDPDDFQTDAGLRIHGADARGHSKKPFRVYFRDDYGDARLNFPLLANAAVDSFDKLVLRPGAHDGWTSPHSVQAAGATYLRDEFARRTQMEMGQVAVSGDYVHLYINGNYWGMYNVTERPDSEFQSDYFGGLPDNWDVLNSDATVVDGNKTAWDEMQALANAGLSTSQAYQEIQSYLDVDSLIDFMIVHIWSGNTDIFRSANEPQTGNRNKNWYVARDRVDGQFRFFVWDAEFGLGKDHTSNRELNLDLTDMDIADSPARLYTRLRENEEFRLRFADRLQQHFFNDGALTEGQNVTRWASLADRISEAIIPESARWGDNRFGNAPFSETAWQGEIEWVETTFLAERNQIVLDQFRTIGLMAAVDAPVFTQHGGAVGSNFQLGITSTSGQIYYTLDGSDPREAGGAIHNSAEQYTGPFSLLSSGPVRARALDNGVWSALTEAAFIVNVPASSNNLAITEINYNPFAPDAEELAIDPSLNNDFFEFVELQNISADTVDLTNVTFADGIDFSFDNASQTSLTPGEIVVIVANETAFQLRYGNDLPVVGTYSGQLRNGGESVTLLDYRGEVIHDLEYEADSNWPNRADGNGSSLQIIEPSAPLDNGANWRSSVEFHGSPGVEGALPTRDIVINEVLTHTDLPLVDAIELYNHSSDDIDISGWFLSDETGDYQKFQIPANTVLAADNYIVFDESDFNPTPGVGTSFSLNSFRGDDVWLLAADPQSGKLTRFVDHIEFGAAANGESLGRYPNGIGDIYPLAAVTLAAHNSVPRIGPLLISEVMYNAPDPDGDGGVDAGNLEFVEIYNPTASTVSLQNWTLGGGVEFSFGATTSIPASGVLAVVPFDPTAAENAQLLSDFRTYYEISPGVPLVGGYSGQLGNGGDEVILYRPDDPPLEDPTFIPQLWEDGVTYDDEGEWPAAADGAGSSLTRLLPDTVGGEPLSWFAQTPTPGSVAIPTVGIVTKLEINVGLTDPEDLPGIPQPTSWAQQKSRLENVELTFNYPLSGTADDIVGHLRLTNLGVDAPNTPDVPVDLSANQLTIRNNVLFVSLPVDQLPDGVYQLEILPSMPFRDGLVLDGNGDGVGGDEYMVAGDEDNQFYQLTGDWNGDEGVSIFDFGIFSYWFGTSVPRAPSYVDLNGDGGVTIFDFSVFAAAFGSGIRYPVSARPLGDSDRPEIVALEQSINEHPLKDSELDWLLWNWRQ